MTLVEFETVNCTLCGSDQSKIIVKSYDRLHPQNPGEFAMVQCQKCGLIYQNPRPTQDTVGQFYPKGEYYSFNSQKSFFLASLEAAIINHFGPTDKHVKVSLPMRALGNLIVKRVGVPNFPKTGDAKEGSRRAQVMSTTGNRNGRTRSGNLSTEKPSILDIGCGDGFVLSVLKKIGWEVYGTEVSQEAVKAAQKNSLTVYLGQVEDIDFKNKRFDFIRMSHSLEHLPDPKRSLKLVNTLLKPDGQLIILVPNYQSPAAKVFGKRWLGLDLPRHLYVFTPTTITKLLKKADLKVTKIKQFGSKGALGGFTFLVNDLSRTFRKKNIKTHRMLSNQYLAGIDLLIHYSTALFNIGDNMEVWGKRVKS